MKTEGGYGPGNSATYIYSVHLKKGWNLWFEVVEERFPHETGLGEHETIKLTTTDPGGMKWQRQNGWRGVIDW